MKNMREIVIKYRAIVVAAVILVVCAGVFLFGSHDVTMKPIETQKEQSGCIADSTTISAVFVPTYEKLQTIAIEPNTANEGSGTLTLALYDEFGEEVASDTIDFADLDYGYMNEFKMDAKVTPGAQYLIQVSAADCVADALSLSTTTMSCGNGEIRNMTYSDGDVANTILMCETTYRGPFTMRTVLPYVLVLLIVGIVAVLAIEGKGIGRIGRIAVYGLFFIAGCVLILMNDEGRQAITYDGTELTHQAGAEDYRGYLTISDADQYSGLLANTHEFMLKKGDYVIQMSYQTSTEDNTVEVTDDGETTDIFNLSPAATYAELPFSVSKDTQNSMVSIYYSGSGMLKINSLALKPAGSFYTDNYFVLVLFVLLNIFGLWLYHKNLKQPVDKEKAVTVIALVGLAIVATYPFLNTDLFTGDDLAYHLYRIEGLKDAIRDGQLPAVIMPNALSGNGYLNSVYPYLFLYIPALFRLCGVSLMLSYKMLIFIANVATAAITYVSVKSVAKSRYAGILGAALYVLLPYRFTNIYARGALGETLAMTFIPLLLAGLYQLLFEDKRKVSWLIIALTGLLQSHIISFALGCIITALACLIFIRELIRDKRWLNLIWAGVISVIINVWFLIPFAYFYMNGGLGMDILDWSAFTEYCIEPSFFLNMIGSDEYRYLSFGIPVAVLFAFIPIRYICEKDAEREDKDRFMIFTYVCALLLTVLLTAYGCSDKLMTIPIFERLFTTIQFPWRLFAQISAMVIFVGVTALSESKLVDSLKLRRVIFASLIAVAMFVGMRTLGYHEQYAYDSYTDTYTAGHLDKVRGILAEEGVVRYPYEYRLNRADESELFSSLYPTRYETTQIVDYTKEGTEANVTYVATEEGSELIFPIMGYYGYHVYDENGTEAEYELANKCDIKVALNADGQAHALKVMYEEPIIFVLGVVISALGVIGSIVVYITKRRGSISVKAD